MKHREIPMGLLVGARERGLLEGCGKWRGEGSENFSTASRGMMQLALGASCFLCDQGIPRGLGFRV